MAVTYVVHVLRRFCSSSQARHSWTILQIITGTKYYPWHVVSVSLYRWVYMIVCLMFTTFTACLLYYNHPIPQHLILFLRLPVLLLLKFFHIFHCGSLSGDRCCVDQIVINNLLQFTIFVIYLGPEVLLVPFSNR